MSGSMKHFVNMAQEYLDRILTQQTMHRNAKNNIRGGGRNDFFKAQPNGRS